MISQPAIEECFAPLPPHLIPTNPNITLPTPLIHHSMYSAYQPAQLITYSTPAHQYFSEDQIYPTSAKER